MSSDIHYLTVAEAAELIQSGEISPVALTRACLERIENCNSHTHAFITVLTDSALRVAVRAEKEIRDGCYRGPFHGIPIAHKDILLTRNVRTTAHSRFLENWVPTVNAAVVERLENAGAICLGKTALHEFAYGSPGPNEAFPGARNPWNLEYAPGSSSSGSGAAVASGQCMAATGTDTGGSIRHPASVCGVVGMKATFGLVSTYGAIPLAPSLDHVGPITRSVKDNALMLQAMCGFDSRDQASINVSLLNFGNLIGKNIEGMRIGVPRKFIEKHQHSAEVIKAFDKSLAVLCELGALIEEIEPFLLNECIEAVNVIIGFEAYQYHQENLRNYPDLFGAAFKERFNRLYSVTEYENALVIQKQLKNVYSDLFNSGINVVVSPGKEVPADLMTDLLASPSRRPVSNRIYSLTGMPALTMPMALSEKGLPMGIQIAADFFREDIIYQVASAFESTTNFYKIHPMI